MVPYLLVTAVECTSSSLVPPCLCSEGTLIPADTARVILTTLQAGRAVAEEAHHEGFDSLIDSLESALGDRHASAMRALVQEGQGS